VVTFRIERSDATLQPDSAAGKNPSFVILVIDDGVGIDKASARTRGGGRGLANMRARSEALGGTFTLHSDATGTVARLAL
jgi:signal transduction histidine kinase